MKHKYIFVALAFFTHCLQAQVPIKSGALGELFKGPVNAGQHDQWLAAMRKWRGDERVRIKYDNTLYSKPELQWIKHTFIYVQMMVHDRYFYDPVTRKYTVIRYVNDLKRRYGGIDAVLIWPTYPNIGVDNRNQFDLTADMPGGKAAVRQMIKDFKANGVRVFFPIMIWDNGTKQIRATMPQMLIKEMKDIGADGLNGDTMTGVSEDFYLAFKKENYPLALQPENNIRNMKGIEWNTMSWGYFWPYEYVPGVSIYKWLEPKHQVNITNRWATDKTNDLQYAFFNGIGYNSWENVWSVWNQISDRDAEAIRRIGAIYRKFPNAWSSSDWEPHIAVMQKGVFASKFPNRDKTIYTFVNRDTTDATGDQIALPFIKGTQYYDLWSGSKIIPQIVNKKAVLNFAIEGRGYGALLVAKGADNQAIISAFLAKMKKMSAKRLTNYSAGWKFSSQKMVPIKKTTLVSSAPDGMVTVPGIKRYNFESVGVMIEGSELPMAVGVQHYWDLHPSRSQKHVMDIDSFYIDKFPVTNKQFKRFLIATKYHPADDHNFLKYWINGTYADGASDEPVTWISLEDARAYATWAGKRLPHEWEWQYAAQGNDNRLYPWGNENDKSKYPKADTSRAMHRPSPVNKYINGASPFGVEDMVGNIWQWTDEYMDEHSRSAILKGSSYYHAQSSAWYFPPALELNKYGKYLLMAPSLDRAATIGFRCVVDRK